jgi:hypothetical protein
MTATTTTQLQPVAMPVAAPAVPSQLPSLRVQLADAVRSVASRETDARVVQRLYEVAALITGELVAEEAKAAILTAPSPMRRFGGDKPGTEPA